MEHLGMKQSRNTDLLFMLIVLTLLFVSAQIIFFSIHYKVSELVDSLVNSSILVELSRPVILLPILGFITIQIVAYIIFVTWIWFIATSLQDLFNLSKNKTYLLGIFFWLLGCLAILSLNQYYFPHSFFSDFSGLVF